MSTQSLCRAVAQRNLVSFTHKGEHYTVEPHSVGYEAPDERGNSPLLLRAWHGGRWTDFQVKFMSPIEIRSEQFSDRTGHVALWHILCDVSGRRSEPKYPLH
ncbi:MAG: hypothetical protein WA418_15980 [Bradyrhizobium sp.]